MTFGFLARADTPAAFLLAAGLVAVLADTGFLSGGDLLMMPSVGGSGQAVEPYRGE
jgi:hypothetical protein